MYGMSYSKSSTPVLCGLPLAGKLVKEDIRLAYRSFDMAPMMEALKKGEKISEVDLAKVEKVILDGSMPMAKYYLIHWGASLSDTEKQMALNWAKEQRAAFIRIYLLMRNGIMKPFARFRIQWLSTFVRLY